MDKGRGTGDDNDGRGMRDEGPATTTMEEGQGTGVVDPLGPLADLNDQWSSCIAHKGIFAP